MQRKKMWLMVKSEFDSFEHYRMQRYKASEIKREVNDHPLTKYFIYLLVHFFRKRRISRDDPFKGEKLIHTAVCLFKRFYLVNQYTQSPVQNFFVCVYLSLKMNELSHEAVALFANAWRSSSDKLFPGEKCYHFKDPGYSEKQLHFLRGIGFQIGRSPIIPGVQSLFHRVQQSLNNPDLCNEIQETILELIRRVYVDDRALFLYEGPKLALAIIILAIRQKQAEKKISNKIQDLFGADVFAVFERNRIETEGICTYISDLKKLDSRHMSEKAKELRDNVLKLKNNAYEIPQRKSPTFGAKSRQLEEH